MQFLAVFLPLALLVDAAWLVLYLHDRRLVRHVRARYPEVFETLRGRSRRWYDPPEEVWVQSRDVRGALRRQLTPLAACDVALAECLAGVDAGERWMRRSVWIGAVLTAALIAGLWLKDRGSASEAAQATPKSKDSSLARGTSDQPALSAQLLAGGRHDREAAGRPVRASVDALPASRAMRSGSSDAW